MALLMRRARTKSKQSGVQTYFISNGSAIKIGKSRNVAVRFRQLQTSSHVPLRLVAVVDGDRERQYHRKYARHRVRGEWFKINA
jgi:hypothetical protein